jgi:hypothetical protein
MCRSGLHASKHPFDALRDAPGRILHKVKLEDATHSDGKSVGRRRKIIATIDATTLLREFAQWCALQIIDNWEAPAIVLDYLETGDESLREDVWLEVWAAKEKAGVVVATWLAAEAAGAAAIRMTRTQVAARLAARASVEAGAAGQRTKFQEMVNEAFGD